MEPFPPLLNSRKKGTGKAVRSRLRLTRIRDVLFPAVVSLSGLFLLPSCMAGETPTTVVTPTGMEMIRLPGGTFLMGDTKGADDEKPVRRIRLDAFLMDRTEVTQKSYRAITGKNPSRFKGEGHPVQQVSWVDAIRYCNLRSLREGLTPCYDEKTLECNFDANGYRLPTEAEWEYACRAGTVTKFSFGDNESRLAKYGWYKENAGKTTHPVATKAANPWGLFDMHGNVEEWCHDYYSETAYQTGEAEAVNPRGPPRGEKRVLRGGSWSRSADGCRSAVRNAETPQFADVCFGADNYGFRCVRKAEP